MYLCQPPQPKAELYFFFNIQVDINEIYHNDKHGIWISLTTMELDKVGVRIFLGVA
jgi:small basic protein